MRTPQLAVNNKLIIKKVQSTQEVSNEGIKKNKFYSLMDDNYVERELPVFYTAMISKKPKRLVHKKADRDSALDKLPTAKRNKEIFENFLQRNIPAPKPPLSKKKLKRLQNNS